MAECDRCVQALEALFETGSFTDAAEALGVAQPSLSQYVRRLEVEWGAEMVDRSARPLRPTEAGAMVLAVEREVCERRAACRRAIEDLAAGVRGTVRVGVSEYREVFFLTKVLPRFRERFPEVEILLEEGTTRELEAFALEGRTDLSIGIAPVGPKAEEALEVVPLYEERLLLAMPAAQAADIPSSVKKLDFAHFDGRPFIVVKSGQMIHGLFETLCRRTGARPRIVLESESLVSALALARAGLGSAIVTEALCRASETAKPGELRFFEMTPEVPPRTVVALLRRGRFAPKAVRSLLEVMRETARDEGL